MTTLATLFFPWRVGKFGIKNRILQVPMGTFSYDFDEKDPGGGGDHLARPVSNPTHWSARSMAVAQKNMLNVKKC